MRNVFLFIRRYFNFLFFVVLQIIALYILFHYNEFHQAAFMRVANEMTGRISTRYNNVESYFTLEKTNEQLAKENEQLRNQLKQNYEIPDSSKSLVRDTINLDTNGNARKYFYRGAKVVNNSIGLQNNYLVIHRGENQGVQKDMGVVGPSGIVGTVINTSANYAVVMSLLNRQSRLSAKLKKSGETGTVFWNGESPLYLTMTQLPKTVPVVKGDTIVTSQYASYRFPEGIMVGIVVEELDDKASGFYTLKIKPATNFYSIEYVTVVENLQKDEQKKLEDALKNNQ
jgi:rod shape-determining protein MreC